MQVRSLFDDLWIAEKPNNGVSPKLKRRKYGGNTCKEDAENLHVKMFLFKLFSHFCNVEFVIKLAASQMDRKANLQKKGKINLFAVL